MPTIFIRVCVRISHVVRYDTAKLLLYLCCFNPGKARHTIYDYYRSHKDTIPLSETFDLPEESLSENVVQALLPCLKNMVEQLPVPYREAILLTEYQGLTQRELAQRLNLSFSGAKSRVQRGREKLKQMLLDCCHFVFDRRGGILAYHPGNECCLTCSCNIG